MHSNVEPCTWRLRFLGAIDVIPSARSDPGSDGVWVYVDSHHWEPSETLSRVHGWYRIRALVSGEVF